MNEIVKRAWLPASGSISTITISAIQNPINIHFVAQYILIGVLGALGGLLVKLAWGYLKRKFPKLKNMDK